jgi:uncharacterized protein YlxW (UPF0749 family)
MTRIRQMPWAIALVVMVLGFMLSMQFKVHQAASLKDAAAFARAEELAQQLEQAEQERNEAMAELEQLRAQVRNLANQQAEFQGLAEQLELAQLYAGLIPLTGPGVVVEMRDSTRPPAPGENPNLSIIHDEDVLRVVNDLFAAGAEAIAINEQRLIARSEIRCTGPTIMINGVRTAPPIVIKAVGNADELEAVLTMPDGIAETLQVYGIQVTVKKLPQVTIPAYKGSLKLKWASPVR